MASRTSSTLEPPRRLPAEPEPGRSRPEAVTLLEGLLRALFPEPNSLDLITIDDILRRYPLTGLGAPALTAIEQSQRIVRARGDYVQAGLGEFHIGLIYMNWEDSRAAANQFALARQPWTLANDTSAQCLAHFAQGLALYHAFHNEAAMMLFSRAERILKRPLTGAQGARLSTLADRMRPLLLIVQETLRVALWPEEETPGTEKGQYLTVPPLAAARREDQVIYGPPPRSTGAAPGDARRAFERMHRAVDGKGGVPLPISNLPGGLGDVVRGPVPGHIVVEDRFGWYRISEKKGEFLPSVAAGTWLLADSEVDERLTSEREYVVVGSARANLGSITVTSISHTGAVPFCYLGYRVADEAAPDLHRLFIDDTQQSPASEDLLVLAVVQGFWYGLNGHGLPAA